LEYHSHVPFTPLISPTYLLYYALINYVLHSKLELQFASQKLSHTSRSTVEFKV
jgi:hypothetical protein